MVDRARYRRGAHTVTDLKYHMVWKTKYGYPVLRGEIGLRLRDLLRMIAAEHDMDNGNDSSKILIHLWQFEVQRFRDSIHIDGIVAKAV